MKPKEITSGQWLRYNVLFIAEHFLGQRLFKLLLGKRRERLYQEIGTELKGTGRGGVMDTSEIEWKGTLDEFKVSPYVPNRATVFRGMAADWPAVKNWDFNFFDHHYGEMDVILTDNVGFIDPDNPQEFDTLKLSEYLSALKSGSLKYLKFSSLVHKDKLLQADLDRPWLEKFHLPGSFGPRFFLFIGGKNTRTPIHNAIPGTVFIQIEGQKKWTIYPTEERIFLDVHAERRSYFHTPANPGKGDDPRFPLARYAKRYEVVLEPGDVLWIPPFVWHEVDNLTDSIGVAYKFANLPAAFRSTRKLSTLFFLSTRPTLFSAYMASLFKKEDYLFERKQEEIDKVF